jgi:hypothetical protein
LARLPRIILDRRLGSVILLFLSLPFLAFPEIIFGQQTLYWTDLSWIHYPRHIFAAEEWLAGRIPLWDPYQHNGLPFLAETQVGSLYPLSAIFLTPWLPSLELSLFILSHFTLAALFTFILARSLALSYPAATVAGLAFGFGGVLMAQVPNLNIMTGAVWLPLILYGALQTTRQRRWWVALLAGLPLALQIFTAQPQIVFYTLVVLGGYGVYRTFADFFFGPPAQHQNRGYALRTILLLLVIILSGLLLAAPQLLPTLELQQLSVRSEERGFRFLTENSFPPPMWLQLLLPGAFGNNVTGFKGGDAFQEDFIYIGFIPLLLTGFSLAQRRKRDMPFFMILFAAGVLLAMGRYTPLYQYVIQYLPGFALFRIPARWLMVVNLALALLAGFGLETLLQEGLSRRKLGFILTAGLSLLVALASIWFFRAALQSWLEGHDFDLYGRLAAAFLDKGYSLNPIYRDRLLMGWLTGLTVPVLLLSFNLLVAMSLFTLLAARRLAPATFSLLLILAVSLDLIAAGGTVINPLKPARWWTELSQGALYVVEHVGEARVFPLGMGSEEATVSHLGQYFPSVYRIRSAGGHGSSLMLARTGDFLDEAHPVQAVRVLGVRYLLTEGQMGADAAAAFPIAYSDETGYVYENPIPLPRAFVVHQTLQVDSPEAALAHFQSLALDPRQTVVLEAEQAPSLPAGPPVESQATILAENPQRIEIQVQAAAPGYLVLLDTFYPGWAATLDGQPTPIYRANYLSRAVFVPVGQHQVIFTYRPFSFRIGVGLALLVLGLLASVGWLERPKERMKDEG